MNIDQIAAEAALRLTGFESGPIHDAAAKTVKSAIEKDREQRPNPAADVERSWQDDSPAAKAPDNPLVENYIRMFAHDILHGDEVHRAWLLEAAECFIEGKHMPPPRAKTPIPEPSPPQPDAAATCCPTTNEERSDAIATCPKCNIERADYEGHNKHLPNCPNCGSETDPVVTAVREWTEDDVIKLLGDTNGGCQRVADAVNAALRAERETQQLQDQWITRLRAQQQPSEVAGIKVRWPQQQDTERLDWVLKNGGWIDWDNDWKREAIDAAMSQEGK